MRYSSIEELKRSVGPAVRALGARIFQESQPAIEAESRREPIVLTLSFPPSSNRYWRNYNGKTVKSEEARKYQADVKKTCAGISPFSGEVAVTLRFYRPRKVGDLDNRIKICLDALQGIAFHDDKQVGEIFARRYEDKKNPRVEIFVRLLEN
jgi:crossover junction endodeoxyribonuclease RusA